MQVQVIRRFPGSPDVGAILDTTDWPVNRAHQLIKRRWVVPVLGSASEPPRRGPGRPPKQQEA